MSPSFRLELDAPAKVNLGLRIVGRRADGYHELTSLFAPLDLADAIALSVESADAPSVALRLTGDGLGAPPGGANLAVRAAHAFLKRSGVAARVAIALTKRTPAAAGLGGGSSDAAAVLRGLARAFPGALDPSALDRVALSLGADVPYFLDPRPAWVTGIGERREPVAALPSLALLLANPGEALATAEVFRAFDALADRKPQITRSEPKASEDHRAGAQRGKPSGAQRAEGERRSGGIAERRSNGAREDRPVDLARALLDDRELAELLHNDLEAAAVRLCPPIARLRHELVAAGARAIGMSGSGATLFGVFPDRVAAERAAQRWTPSGPVWTRVAVTREAG